MFAATLSHAGQFIKVIDAISSMIDQGTFYARESGMSLKAMDPSHVAMIEMDMPPDAFAEYKCDELTPIRVDFNDLNRFVKRGSADDTVQLLIDAEKNKLKIKFKSKTKKSTRTFSLGLMAMDEEDEAVPSPKLDFKAGYELKSAVIQSAIKDAEVVGDYLGFTATEGMLTLEAKGDAGEVTIEIQEFEGTPKLEGSHKAEYSLEYLKDIAKGVGAAAKVTLSFSGEMPIQFACSLGDDTTSLTYLLAPKVEEEVDDTEFESTTETDTPDVKNNND